MRATTSLPLPDSPTRAPCGRRGHFLDAPVNVLHRPASRRTARRSARAPAPKPRAPPPGKAGSQCCWGVPRAYRASPRLLECSHPRESVRGSASAPGGKPCRIRPTSCRWGTSPVVLQTHHGRSGNVVATPTPSVAGMATERVTRSLSLARHRRCSSAAPRSSSGPSRSRPASTRWSPAASVAALRLRLARCRGVRARVPGSSTRRSAPSATRLAALQADAARERALSASSSRKYSLAVRRRAGSVGPARLARRRTSRAEVPFITFYLAVALSRLDRRLRSAPPRRPRSLGGHRRHAVRATRRPGWNYGRLLVARHLPARVPRHRRDRLRTARRAGARAAARERYRPAQPPRDADQPVARARAARARTPLFMTDAAQGCTLLQSRLARVTRAHARAGARQRLVRRRARRGPGAQAGGLRDGARHADTASDGNTA